MTNFLSRGSGRLFRWLPWGVSGVCLVLALVVASNNSTLSEKSAKLERQSQEQKATLKKLDQEKKQNSERVQSLEKDQSRLKNDLQQVVGEKESLASELSRTKSELSTKLESEVKKGDIVIRERGGDLVIDVSDKILFDIGKADVKGDGQKVLRQVAAALMRTKDRVFLVGGHTDSAKVKSADVKERFPTNWELSAARATQVVRFLQEKCGVPGRRLVAAGYAQFRPVANNASEDGRQKNRRIELALLKDAPAP